MLSSKSFFLSVCLLISSNVTIADQLNFWCSAWLKNLCIAAANSQGHVKVNVISKPESELALSLKAYLQTGDAPDIVALHSSKLEQLRGNLVDISSLQGSEELIASLAPKAVELATHDNMVIGLPWILDVPVIYYRTDLIEKAGVETPANFDDLIQAVKTAEERLWAGRNIEDHQDPVAKFAATNAAFMGASTSLWQYQRNKWHDADNVGILPLQLGPDQWPSFCRLCGCCDDKLNLSGWYIAVLNTDKIETPSIEKFLRHVTLPINYMKEFSQYATIPASSEIIQDTNFETLFPDRALVQEITNNLK